MKVAYREMQPSDLSAARELGRRTEHMGIGTADEPSELRKFLDKNPGLSRAATTKQDGTDRLIGTVLTGYDGAIVRTSRS